MVGGGLSVIFSKKTIEKVKRIFSQTPQLYQTPMRTNFSDCPPSSLFSIFFFPLYPPPPSISSINPTTLNARQEIFFSKDRKPVFRFLSYIILSDLLYLKIILVRIKRGYQGIRIQESRVRNNYSGVWI